MNNLAVQAELCRARQDYDQLEALLKRVLAIRQKAYGLNHLDVARSLDALAQCYCDREKFLEAELLLKRSLQIKKRVSGATNMDVCKGICELAFLYELQVSNRPLSDSLTVALSL